MAEHGVALARLAGGRATKAAALHMTLVFVGAVRMDALAGLGAAADTVRSTPFVLTLDRLGAWRGNGVGWLAPSNVPDTALELSRDLRAALRDHGIAFDAKEFKAHVTLVRKLLQPVAPTAVDPIDWPVHEFVLMRSHLRADGAGYECIGRWQLTGGR
jgi:2'-5' RNA ligase